MYATVLYRYIVRLSIQKAWGFILDRVAHALPTKAVVALQSRCIFTVNAFVFGTQFRFPFYVGAQRRIAR